MNIVFLSCTFSYPYEFAAVNTKVNAMALSLIRQGHSVCVVGEPRGYRSVTEIERKETTDGVPYIIYPSKGKHAYLHNLKYIKKDLKKLFKTDKDNILILCENGNFLISSLFGLWAHSIGYHVSTIYHEWRLAFVHKYPWYKRWSFVFNNKYFGKWSDSILPISHFLQDKANVFSKPQFILPVLCSYNCKNVQNPKPLANSFSYCASAGYWVALKFVIDSYRLYKNDGGQFLLNLILSGTESQLQNVREYITQCSLNEYCNIRTRLSNQELKEAFETSNALLIPLDPENIQDVARFSQKISEYLASSRPIVTCSVGEIPYYFKNNYNAYISEYNIEDYSMCLQQVESDDEMSNNIGKAGFEIGQRYFDSDTICKQLVEFYKKTIHNG